MSPDVSKFSRDQDSPLIPGPADTNPMVPLQPVSFGSHHGGYLCRENACQEIRFHLPFQSYLAEFNLTFTYAKYNSFS